MSLIQLHNLSIGYPKHIIAKDLNLSFNGNEVVCLLGANGCGKTTLLKTILGVLPKLSGELLIQNKDQKQWQRNLLAQFLGYVPQAHNHVFPFTAEEVVLMGRTAHLSWCSSPKQVDKDIAQSCIERLGIAHLAQQPYTQLSGGERQLVLIARALAQEPTFLIMDEPTASLDFGNQIRVLEQIEQLKQQGLSILMTTHQPEHAMRIADRIILFHQGNVIADGDPQSCLTADNLATIYSLDKSVISKNLHFASNS